jgi:hypothetical protein
MSDHDIITKHFNDYHINPLYLEWRDRKLSELLCPIVVAPFPYVKKVSTLSDSNEIIYTGWTHINLFHKSCYEKNGFITNEMIEYTLQWLLYELWESTTPYVHGNLTKTNLVVSYSKLWVLFNTYQDFRPLIRFKQHSELYRCVYLFKDLYTFGLSVTTNNRMTDPNYTFPYYDIDKLNEYDKYILSRFNFEEYLEHDFDDGTNITPIYYKEEDKDIHYQLIQHVHNILLMIRLL